jgi:hypothetical protein
MLKIKRLFPILGLALAGVALAQPPDPVRFYKLDFVVKEVESGKTVNSRSFSTMLAVQVPGRDSPAASIRAGGRVPVPSGGSNTSFNFVELGVNLDVRDLRESQSDVSLNVTADISTMAPPEGLVPPVNRHNRWSGTVLVPVKKPTTVFASDDVSSKRQLQLELTATPVK